MKLKINNKDYLLKWGFAAFEKYCDDHECDLVDIEKALSSDKLVTSTRAIYNLTVAAIECGCKYEKVECDITYDILRDWLDTQDPVVALDIIADWKKSYYQGFTIAKYFFGQDDEVIEEKSPKNKKKAASSSVKP